MRGIFAGLGMTVFALLCAALLFIYIPAFFAVNWGLVPELSPRYIAGSGVLMAGLMITIVAVQIVTPFFMVSLVLQVFVAGLSWWLVLYTYHSPMDAHTFALGHLGIAAALIVWNLVTYRRHLRILMDD